MQRTLVVCKPDAVQRRLVGRILSRFEDKGIRLAALKMLRVSPPLARRMYEVHRGKDFYGELLKFITSGPVVAAVLEGMDVISVVRRMVGPTFGPDAPAGTIRGDLGMSRRFNLIHASDSPSAARREIAIFFRPGDLVQHPQAADWIYARQMRKLI